MSLYEFVYANGEFHINTQHNVSYFKSNKFDLFEKVKINKLMMECVTINKQEYLQGIQLFAQYEQTS